VTTADDPLSPDLLREMRDLCEGEQRITVAAGLLKYAQLGADHAAQGIIVDFDPAGQAPPTPTMNPNVRQFPSMLTDLGASSLQSFDPAVHDLLPTITHYLFQAPPPATEIDQAVGLLAAWGANPDDIRAVFDQEPGRQVMFDAGAYTSLLERTLADALPSSPSTRPARKPPRAIAATTTRPTTVSRTTCASRSPMQRSTML
jgi:hypothetical protein